MTGRGSRGPAPPHGTAVAWNSNNDPGQRFGVHDDDNSSRVPCSVSDARLTSAQELQHGRVSVSVQHVLVQYATLVRRQFVLPRGTPAMLPGQVMKSKYGGDFDEISLKDCSLK